jgi:uncharacterized protein HemX
MTRRPSSALHGCLVLVAVLSAGCSHQKFVQTSITSLQAAAQLTALIRAQANEISDQQQKQAMTDLEASIAKIPTDAPGRKETVDALKASTAAQLTAVRVQRDRVLRATAESNRVLGMAALLLPLLDDQPEKKAEVVRLVGEAYAALEKAK